MAVFLVAEDDRDFRELLAGVFEDAGHQVYQAADGRQALEMISARKYDVVLTDIKLPVRDGMEVLRETKLLSPDTEVLIMTAYGTLDSAAQAMKIGAADYLQKPFSIPELEMRVEKAIRHGSLAKEVAYLRHTQEIIYRLEDIVGKSDAIKGVLEQVRVLANDPSPVLIKGETGTGRLLIAGALHFNSGRSENGFIRVNCTVQNPDHLESDLFGHAKDAFPGANHARIGRIEQANGGTIFIEEITEAPLKIQAKLLDRCFAVLGVHAFQDLGQAVCRLFVAPAERPRLLEIPGDLQRPWTGHFLHRRPAPAGQPMRAVERRQ